MIVPAGTQFGRYEIGSPIRKGGMGEVYLAQDTQLRRPEQSRFSLPISLTTETSLIDSRMSLVAASSLPILRELVLHDDWVTGTRKLYFSAI